MLCGEATNTNFIVCGLTLTGLKHTIYRTQGEHANHYATDAVFAQTEILIKTPIINMKQVHCILIQ
jgi:hypothetical protein